MVCAVQKNDAQAYALFRTKAVNVSVTALLRTGKDKSKGLLKTHPPGMYALVEFVRILEGVFLIFLTSVLTSAVAITHARTHA